VGNLYEMFHTRILLHRRAYQHKTSNIIEYMLTEALEEADSHLKLQGSNGYANKLTVVEYDNKPSLYTEPW